MVWTILCLTSALVWIILLLLPWRAWDTRECLDAKIATPEADLSQVTVLIPARNEADVIGDTLRALNQQGQYLKIIVVDDQSTDRTVQAIQNIQTADRKERIQIISGKPLPNGWTGKLWALEQGLQQVGTPYTLLLDADIELEPGTLKALLNRLQSEKRQLISLMAELRMVSLWEKLLMPAYIYFFKLIYPFHLSNSPLRRIAGAAGGCVLLETHALHNIGGFSALRGAIIDDCMLAQKIKQAGGRTWIGLTHSAKSARAVDDLPPIWEMVERTAYTQLRYSVRLLLLCTLLMVIAFWVPIVGLWLSTPWAKTLSLVALLAMMTSYYPTLLYYRRDPLWALALPIIGTLYLAMTWSSAIRYWRGVRSKWKERIYVKGG